MAKKTSDQNCVSRLFKSSCIPKAYIFIHFKCRFWLAQGTHTEKYIFRCTVPLKVYCTSTVCTYPYPAHPHSTEAQDPGVRRPSQRMGWKKEKVVSFGHPLLMVFRYLVFGSAAIAVDLPSPILNIQVPALVQNVTPVKFADNVSDAVARSHCVALGLGLRMGRILQSSPKVKRCSGLWLCGPTLPDLEFSDSDGYVWQKRPARRSLPKAVGKR